MSRVDVGRMRRQLERTGPKRATKKRQHDRDGCGICHDWRVKQLCKRGLVIGLARNLRDAGTACAPSVAALEAMTDAELAVINDAFGAVPVGDRGQQT